MTITFQRRKKIVLKEERRSQKNRANRSGINRSRRRQVKGGTSRSCRWNRVKRSNLNDFMSKNDVGIKDVSMVY